VKDSLEFCVPNRGAIDILISLGLPALTYMSHDTEIKVFLLKYSGASIPMAYNPFLFLGTLFRFSVFASIPKTPFSIFSFA